MRTQTLGGTSLLVTRLAYGCWRLAGSEGGPSPAAGTGEAAVLAAVDAGFTFFDLADIYGGGECERILGRAIRGRPGLRDRLVIATKCGIRRAGDGGPAAPYRYDSSAAYIQRGVEGSLQRLGIESIDALLIHRPDYLMEPAEVAEAFVRLRQEGKVREFGVSNFRPAQLTALQESLPWPLATHQIEISLVQRAAFDDGSLEQCLINGLTPTAWSPLGKGALGAPGSGALGDKLRELARELETTPAGVALAWLLRHPAGVVPIIGTTRPERIKEAAKAESVELSSAHWYALLEAARGVRLP